MDTKKYIVLEGKIGRLEGPHNKLKVYRKGEPVQLTVEQAASYGTQVEPWHTPRTAPEGAESPAARVPTAAPGDATPVTAAPPATKPTKSQKPKATAKGK